MPLVTLSPLCLYLAITLLLTALPMPCPPPCDLLPTDLCFFNPSFTSLFLNKSSRAITDVKGATSMVHAEVETQAGKPSGLWIWKLMLPPLLNLFVTLSKSPNFSILLTILEEMRNQIALKNIEKFRSTHSHTLQATISPNTKVP